MGDVLVCLLSGASGGLLAMIAISCLAAVRGLPSRKKLGRFIYWGACFAASAPDRAQVRFRFLAGPSLGSEPVCQTLLWMRSISRWRLSDLCSSDFPSGAGCGTFRPQGRQVSHPCFATPVRPQARQKTCESPC